MKNVENPSKSLIKICILIVLLFNYCINGQSQCLFNREGITIINFENKQDLFTFIKQDEDCKLLNIAASCF